VPVEAIALLAGHNQTATTEMVYRHQIVPAMLPREAFFAPKEAAPADKASGRIAAEQITPYYPPGIPVIIPGERITAPLIKYLTSGLAVGMQLPDPADPSLHAIRVVAQN
jgi:arginine decarboxylase